MHEAEPDEPPIDIPAPLDKLIGPVLETKVQADRGRSRIIKVLVGFFSCGMAGAVWGILIGVSHQITQYQNTTATASQDHVVITQHSVQIQQVLDAQTSMNGRMDRNDATMLENKKELLNAINTGNVQLGHTLNHIISDVGELKGELKGRADAASN